MENVSLFGAFIAGVLSFISPCVLPLIPGYLSFISGVSLEEMRGMPVAAGAGGGTVTVSTRRQRAAKRQVIITSLFFILGFSLVFVSLGASATYLGQFLMERLDHLREDRRRAADHLRPAHHRRLQDSVPAERSARPGQHQARQHARRRIVGISFAFGWTPCIGPILSAILLVAAQQDSVNQGILLLSVYSLGLAIPFLLTALAINQFFVAFSKIRRTITRSKSCPAADDRRSAC